MAQIILFAVGSPLVVDYEESASRSGVAIAAGVRNHDGPAFSSEAVRIVETEDLTAADLELSFLVPLFTPVHRQTAVRQAERLGFVDAATLLDPTSVYPKHLTLGRGVYVNAGCALGGMGRLGDFVLVNRGATLGHHADLGDYVSIGPGAVLAGQVAIGKGSTVGAGAVVLPGVRIGSNVLVSAGAVVTRDVPDDVLVFGNPARIARAAIGGGRRVAID